MDDIVRGALAGIAIGGFAATMVEVNIIALYALWQFNCLAIETACVMAKAPLTKIIKERRQRRQQQLRMAAAQREDEDNSEPNENES